MSNLSAKQLAFVSEYLKDKNGAAAAVRAGYAPRSAKVHATRMLQHGGIRAAVDEGLAKMAKSNGVTADRVIAELARIGFSSVKGVFNDKGALKTISELTEDEAAAISSIELGDDGAMKIRFWDKRAALVDLGKHLGLFKEAQDLPAAGGLGALLLGGDNAQIERARRLVYLLRQAQKIVDKGGAKPDAEE